MVFHFVFSRLHVSWGQLSLFCESFMMLFCLGVLLWWFKFCMISLSSEDNALILLLCIIAVICYVSCHGWFENCYLAFFSHLSAWFSLRPPIYLLVSLSFSSFSLFFLLSLPLFLSGRHSVCLSFTLVVSLCLFLSLSFLCHSLFLSPLSITHFLSVHLSLSPNPLSSPSM